MPWRPEDARPMSRKHGREGGRSAGRSRPELPPNIAGTSAQMLSRLKMIMLKSCGRNFCPDGRNFRPAGTSAHRGRNFRPIEPQPDLSPLWLVTYPFGPYL